MDPEIVVDAPVSGRQRPDEIPDRVSSKAGSPYYFPWWRKVGVKVNVEVIFNCAEFCKSEGWVLRYVPNTNGRGGFKREQGDLVTVPQHGVKVETYWRF